MFLPEFRQSWDFTIWQYEALHHPQAYADAVVDNRQPERPRLVRLRESQTPPLDRSDGGDADQAVAGDQSG